MTEKDLMDAAEAMDKAIMGKEIERLPIDLDDIENGYEENCENS